MNYQYNYIEKGLMLNLRKHKIIYGGLNECTKNTEKSTSMDSYIRTTHYSASYSASSRTTSTRIHTRDNR